jgi:hypothetical protein
MGHGWKEQLAAFINNKFRQGGIVCVLEKVLRQKRQCTETRTLTALDAFKLWKLMAVRSHDPLFKIWQVFKLNFFQVHETKVRPYKTHASNILQPQYLEIQ